MTAVIEARWISRTYGNRVTALRNVSIALDEGEFVALVGRSGSGKSTLLNILGGLDAPTSGEILARGSPVDYHDLGALVRHRRMMVGFIFQQWNLLPALTARENVEYPLLFNYRPPRERRERASSLLALVGLGEREEHYPHQLSGGEQQRVAIARALVAGPPLILADEPTGNLDSHTAGEILVLLRQLNHEKGVTFLLVTHEHGIARSADRMMELVDGAVVP
jgi:putative ABC transport system ATP-binding protein